MTYYKLDQYHQYDLRNFSRIARKNFGVVSWIKEKLTGNSEQIELDDSDVLVEQIESLLNQANLNYSNLNPGSLNGKLLKKIDRCLFQLRSFSNQSLYCQRWGKDENSQWPNGCVEIGMKSQPKIRIIPLRQKDVGKTRFTSKRAGYLVQYEESTDKNKIYQGTELWNAIFNALYATIGSVCIKYDQESCAKHIAAIDQGRE